MVRTHQGGHVADLRRRLVPQLHHRVAGADGADGRIEPAVDQDPGSFHRFPGISVRVSQGQGGHPGGPAGDVVPVVAHAVSGSELLHPDHPGTEAQRRPQPGDSGLGALVAGIRTEERDAGADHVQVGCGEVEDRCRGSGVEDPRVNASAPESVGHLQESPELLPVVFRVLREPHEGALHPEAPAVDLLHPGDGPVIGHPHAAHPRVQVRVEAGSRGGCRGVGGTAGPGPPKGRQHPVPGIRRGQAEVHAPGHQLRPVRLAEKGHEDHGLPDPRRLQCQGRLRLHHRQPPDLGKGLQDLSHRDQIQAVTVVLDDGQDGAAVHQPREDAHVEGQSLRVHLHPGVEAVGGSRLPLKRFANARVSAGFPTRRFR